MSIFRETLVKHSRKARFCAGCGFCSIKEGDPYANRFSAGYPGFDDGAYAICMTCLEHLSNCESCAERSVEDGITDWIWDCRRETEELAQQQSKGQEDAN